MYTNDDDLIKCTAMLNTLPIDITGQLQVFRRVHTPAGLKYLVSCDQLNIERARVYGGAFEKFEEGTLTFKPTYKVRCNLYNV
jgi:hypothetical protein